MDPFDEVLGRMHVGSSLYAQFQLRAPWGMRLSTGDQARLIVVARGNCWLRWEGSTAPIALDTGACLILKPDVTFTLMDEPQREAGACQALLPAHDGCVIEHGGTGELTELFAGRFSFDAVAAEPLVAPMPALVHVPLGKEHAELVLATLTLMGKERTHGGLGAAFVVDRLTDALFVQAMRALFAESCAFAPGWVTARSDRRVAKAIRAVHADLARSWTVVEMAREAGVSRSSFAAAFTSVVGESPLEYLTSWRLYRARVLLSSSDKTLSEIATDVGYESDTALSRAFKRKVGVPPGTFRRATSARNAVSG